MEQTSNPTPNLNPNPNPNPYPNPNPNPNPSRASTWPAWPRPCTSARRAARRRPSRTAPSARYSSGCCAAAAHAAESACLRPCYLGTRSRHCAALCSTPCRSTRIVRRRGASRRAPAPCARARTASAPLAPRIARAPATPSISCRRAPHRRPTCTPPSLPQRTASPLPPPTAHPRSHHVAVARPSLRCFGMVSSLTHTLAVARRLGGQHRP